VWWGPFVERAEQPPGFPEPSGLVAPQGLVGDGSWKGAVPGVGWRYVYPLTPSAKPRAPGHSAPRHVRRATCAAPRASHDERAQMGGEARPGRFTGNCGTPRMGIFGNGSRVGSSAARSLPPWNARCPRAGVERDAMRISARMIGLATAVCLASIGLGAGAAAAAVTLDLQLNEPAGSTVARDSSGLGHDGRIGSHVRMNGAWADWDRHPPDARIWYGADHLIMVDDAADGSLDPGTANFSVEFRYRSTDKFGNILQKGQARAVGGQIKFQQPGGYVSCMYKSPTNQAAVKTSIPLNDGQWHVIRCDRTATAVTLYVDGVFHKRIRKATGTINNTKPWTIGGKFECNPDDPTQGADSCDYFPGDIDYLTINKG
jgi:hypothetical protein